jgi:hypothetical protein
MEDPVYGARLLRCVGCLTVMQDLLDGVQKIHAPGAAMRGPLPYFQQVGHWPFTCGSNRQAELSPKGKPLFQIAQGNKCESALKEQGGNPCNSFACG